jgi:8-oxo-dGTP diphosphatase
MKHIVVVAAVIIQNRQVFAAQRNASGEMGFKWEFPGGKIETGESHQAALARELHEELSVPAAIGEFFMTINHQYQTFALTMHCYLATIAFDTIHLAVHLDSRWLGVADLDSVDWAAADRPVVDRLRTFLESA